ncbi:MAG: adenylyltransferase/cytidyltransferase family protein, partial [Spirochaetia bacterium]|nr:adenylyltransferase/cytidyltransferase family protein [Spirochaetia bacterium]
MRIALLGGSFNPPHIGHIILAEEILGTLDYDRVLFIPANIPPHKEP